MKNILIIILIVSSLNIYSQDNRLIFPRRIQLNESTTPLNDSISHVVNIKRTNLQKYDNYSIEFGEHNFVVDKIQLIDRGINGYGFWGEDTSNYNSVYLSIINDRISGFINVENEKYKIMTLDDGQYLITTIKNPPLNMANDVLELNEFDKDSISSITRGVEKHKTIRILVLFTSNSGDPKIVFEDIISTIDFTNQTFINSSINAKVELAYLGKTDYNAIPIDSANLHLNRFNAKNDGYIDEVHDLRDLVHADVCALIYHMSGFSIGGMANQNTPYSTSPDKAFMVVNRDYIDSYSNIFPHELGHIVGCNHIDSYQYSGPSFNFQTIMTEGGYGYKAIPYWSNPGVTYEGVATGTSTKNSANIWSINYDAILDFRIVPDHLILSSSPVSNSFFYQFRGNETITVNQNFSISAEKTVVLKSKEITLGDNFSVAVNGSLELSQ